MKISLSRNPFSLLSEFRGSRLLNFAGEPGKGGPASQQSDADEPDPNTPAGKKWAALRERAKLAEEGRAKEYEARLKAEGKAEAMEELKAMFGKAPPAKKEDDTPPEEIQVNPKDEEYVGAIFQRQIKKMGLDKVPEVVSALQKSTQEVQSSNILNEAKANLEKEFESSVPFDYATTLKYAQEKGFGMIATTAEQALRMAHKEMNEEKFIEHYRGGPQQKGKRVPKIVKSGSVLPLEDRDPDEDDTEALQPTTFADARKAAKAMFADNEV